MAIVSIKFEIEQPLAAQNMNGFISRGAEYCLCEIVAEGGFRYEVSLGNADATDIIEYINLIGGAL